MKNKSSIPPVVALSMLLCFATGCSSVGQFKGGYTSTGVTLNQKNYRVIKAGARGKDYGFWLLFIPIMSPNEADAKAKLYDSVGESLTGRAIALANQTEDRSSFTLILFSIPRITVTADVIEFTGENNNQGQTVPPATLQAQ